MCVCVCVRACMHACVWGVCVCVCVCVCVHACVHVYIPPHSPLLLRPSLPSFPSSLQPHKPLMVMEFWTGWFDHWNEPHLTRNIFPDELAVTLKAILDRGASINFYMFHGINQYLISRFFPSEQNAPLPSQVEPTLVS